MNHKEYTEEIKRTVPQLQSPFFDELHMAIGMATETGEVLDAYKKFLAYNKEFDLVNVKEELGDLFWYTFNLMRMLNIDFEEILQTNVDKLKTRYPNGFTEAGAVNRDLKAERKVLEGSSPITISDYTLDDLNYDSEREKQW